MEHLAGRPMGDLLDHFGLTDKDLLFLDEPPGHLKGIAFKVDEGHERKWITVIIEQTPSLINLQREWPVHIIRHAKVLQIFEGSRMF
ncbi:MAG: hypothetical protein JNM56_03065 [Planctomycetia bacterium]|nr:hypothetical protein [Planctomycetia bacterium]